MKAPTPGFAYGPLVGVLARRVESPANFGAFVSEQTKRALLAQVVARFGHAGVVEVGREVAAESAHPFVRVLLAQPTPALLLSAWMQIEVLAHAHNRVRVIDINDGALQLQRFRLGAGDERPLIEEDLFILGVLQGFLAALGFGQFTCDGPLLEARGHLWQLGFERVAPPQAERTPFAGRVWCAHGEIERAVFILAARAILAEERVALVSVAQRLGVSSRSLQRRLTAAKTSFSILLRAARVTLAGTSIVTTQHTALTQVAYRFGFADSAHLCRAFREVVGCSPSQLARLVHTPTGA